MTVVKIFSESVVAETLPKPIEVIVDRVKYKAVTYRDRKFGPPVSVPFSDRK